MVGGGEARLGEGRGAARLMLVAAPLFFVSGAAALVLESLWVRLFALSFGTTALAGWVGPLRRAIALPPGQRKVGALEFMDHPDPLELDDRDERLSWHLLRLGVAADRLGHYRAAALLLASHRAVAEDGSDNARAILGGYAAEAGLPARAWEIRWGGIDEGRL